MMNGQIPDLALLMEESRKINLAIKDGLTHRYYALGLPETRKILDQHAYLVNRLLLENGWRLRLATSLKDRVPIMINTHQKLVAASMPKGRFLIDNLHFYTARKLRHYDGAGLREADVRACAKLLWHIAKNECAGHEWVKYPNERELIFGKWFV